MLRTDNRIVSLLAVFFLGSFALGCGGGGGGGGGGADGGGGGQPDASLEDVPDLTSYMATLTIPSVAGMVPSCCVDFGMNSKDFIENATNNPDNALALLADGLIGNFVDFQQVLDDSITGGDQIILLNHVGLASDTDSFRMDGLIGDFGPSTTYAEASAGAGQFVINPSSYDGNGDALISLTGSMTAGDTTAGPDDFSFAFPIGGLTVSVTLKESQLSGNATISSAGVAYANGTLGGYILLDELYAALNAFATTCTCTGLDGPLFEVVDGSWTSNCVDECTGPNADNCETIATGLACTALPGLLESTADIDLDSNPENGYEGLSVGLEWTGVNATLIQ